MLMGQYSQRLTPAGAVSVFGPLDQRRRVGREPEAAADRGSLFAKKLLRSPRRTRHELRPMGFRGDRRAAPTRVRCSPRRGCRDRPGGRVTAREECGRDARNAERGRERRTRPTVRARRCPASRCRRAPCRALRIVARRRHEAGRGRCARGRWRAANRIAGSHSCRSSTPRLPVCAAAAWNRQVSGQ